MKKLLILIVLCSVWDDRRCFYMMLIIGVFEVLQTELSSGANAAISGISGITYMLLGTRIILFYYL